MHHTLLLSAILIPWLALTMGCSDAGTEEAREQKDTNGGLPDAADSLEPIQSLPAGEWSPLISHGWELEPGKEGYWCKRLTVAEDVWIQGLRTSGAKGIHHLTFGLDEGPAGAFRCTGFSIGGSLLFGTGAGGGQQIFPEGVALKLAAGQSLLINLHLFNTSNEPLAQTVIIEALGVAPSNVEHEAALVLAGAMSFEVLPGESTIKGTCSVGADTTILGVGPHMHLSGRHQKVTVVPPAGEPVVLADTPYDFENQRYLPADPPALAPAGARIEVECTYQNDTGEVLRFGESTNSEMCFAGLYHYPRIANGSTCTL